MTFEFEMATRIRQLEKQMRFVMGLESLAGFEQEPAEQIKETGGPTTLDIGAIADGAYLRRSGTGVIGHDLISIVAVKYAEFTGTQSASLASHASLNITDLEISHTLAKPTNLLFLIAQVGTTANSQGRGNAPIAFTVDGSKIIVGDLPGSRLAIGAGGYPFDGVSSSITSSLFLSGIYEPATTSGITVRVIVMNLWNATKTVYVNRTQDDSNNAYFLRGASTLTLFELEG